MHRVLSMLTLVCAAAAMAVLSACSEGTAASSDADASNAAGAGDRLTIVSTIGMVTDLVRNVAGEQAEVIGLMDAGVDPHLYAPTRNDVQQLLDADAIFYNGLFLEGRMIDSLDRAAEAGKPVFAVAEMLDDRRLLDSDEYQDRFDPHLWMDPAAWASAVEVVRDSLIEIDPENAEAYRANAAAYLEELRQLDAYAVEALRSVPEPQRVLVTAHDAFNYFGERFGYEVVGIQGISTQSEAGAQDIGRLVRLLVDRGIGAVFVESTVSDRNINALIAGARAEGHTVAVGGELFSDAMGDEGTYEGTYIGMIDHNVTTIARALGGDAPERGMNGKLAE